VSRRRELYLLLFASIPAIAQDEVRRRSDELLKQGYNFTKSWTLPARPSKTTMRFEMIVPEVGTERVQLLGRLRGREARVPHRWRRRDLTGVVGGHER
jgi:hypothetical protein